MMTARQISTAVRRGDLSAVEACRSALDRMAAIDGRLHACTWIDVEGALARAAAFDALPPAERSVPLAGVPVAVKDNVCTCGMPTTAGSRMLAGYVPPYTATAAARLVSAGAIIVGKTNCDEFAMGSSTEHSAYGPSHNPWAADRVPGGSSGGSAAAVAADLVPLAIGSDTGGSIRQPAAFCGVLGLKPTYGRVSRYGLIAFASSLDQIGPLSRTAADAADALEVMAGADANDATCSGRQVPHFGAALTGDVRGLRVGVPRALLERGVEAEVLDAQEAALQVLEHRGAIITSIELPHARFGIATYYLVATSEASANLARYDGVRFGLRAAEQASLSEMYARSRAEGFGAEVKRRIMLGTYALSAGYYEACYGKALRVRARIREDFVRAFDTVDLIAMPTTPAPAFRFGECLDDPIRMYLADVFTVGAPLAGLPALSMPCGQTTDRLPIGLQLVGRWFDEETILRAADAFERDTSWWQARCPDLADQTGTERRA